jgi:lactate permease
VAAQAVGGAAGNMITIHNVVAASATVGLLGREGDLIRKTIVPTVYYCLAAGGLAFVWINGLGANLGTLVLAVLIGVLAFAVWRMSRSQGPEGVDRDGSTTSAASAVPGSGSTRIVPEPRPGDLPDRTEV